MDESASQLLLDKAGELLGNKSSAEVLPFAKTAPPLTLPLGNNSFRKMKEAWAKLDIGATNIEQALRQAVAYSPAAILLISDGFETAGNAEAILPLLTESKVFPLLPEKMPEQRELFRLSQLHAPLTAPAQKSVDIRVSAINTTGRPQAALLEVKHDNKTVFSKRIEVPSGSESLFIAQSDPSKEGIKEITAFLKPEDPVFPLSSSTVFLSGEAREKVLLISGAPEDKRLLEESLQNQAYQLTSLLTGTRLETLPELSDFSSVIFNNVALTQLPSGGAGKIEKYVANGGGFIMLGGNRSFGLGGYIRTPIEELLPVELVPPQSEQKRLNIALLLVIDKSRSMAENEKLEYAKEAAREVIRNLKDEDLIGVIGFDDSPFEVVRLAPVSEVRSLALERVMRLFPRGSTNLYPSMEEARRRLEGCNAGRKHMIILTDGKLPDASVQYFEAIKQMRLLGLTVSTVMIGSEMDFGFLRAMAEYGGGAYYQTTNPSNLPKIFLQDVKVRSGEKTLKEQKEFSVRRGSGELISTDIDAFPPLRGYVETKPKERANLELVVMTEGKAEPLLASWRYQKGKVIAFTSDANGRWSSYWASWPQFSRFWSDIIDAVRPESTKRSGAIQFDLRHYLERGVLVLDLTVFSELETSNPTVQLLQPDGTQRNVEFKTLSPGHFRAELEGAKAGKYEARIQTGAQKFTPVAFFLSGELFGEKKGQGYNLPLLEKLARGSGGLVNPQSRDLASLVHKKTVRQELDLFFLLLAAALLGLEILEREVFWRYAARFTLSPGNQKAK